MTQPNAGTSNKGISNMPTNFGRLKYPRVSVCIDLLTRKWPCILCWMAPATRRILGGSFIFQKYPKTAETIKLREEMAIILAQIKVSNKFVTFFTW
jgi:hypothetical protein